MVGGVLELEDGRVHTYHGGYSDYRATKLRGLIAQQRDYVVNQRRLAQLEALVKRFEQIARSKSDPAWGKRLRARKSQLEREKRQAVDRPVLNLKAVNADFTTEAARSDIALRVRGYSRTFGNRTLFDGADLDIAGGERVALVGPNGAGKTTLLRDIVQQGNWDSPTVRIGPSTRVGYAAQEQEVLRREHTILEEVGAGAAIGRNEAFALLRRFLFGWDDLSKKVEDLSGGERNRLQLARLMAVKPSFLVLDEPTNHLDILHSRSGGGGVGRLRGHNPSRVARPLLSRQGGRPGRRGPGRQARVLRRQLQRVLARQAGRRKRHDGTSQDEGTGPGAGKGRARRAARHDRLAGTADQGGGGREAGPRAPSGGRLRPGTTQAWPSGWADRSSATPPCSTTYTNSGAPQAIFDKGQATAIRFLSQRPLLTTRS